MLPPGVETTSLDGADAQTPIDHLTALVGALPAQTIIVLDGYHILERSETQALVNRIVQRLPRTLRLVLITRHDPPLALANLRAHSLLTERRTVRRRLDRPAAGSHRGLDHRHAAGDPLSPRPG